MLYAAQSPVRDHTSSASLWLQAGRVPAHPAGPHAGQAQPACVAGLQALSRLSVFLLASRLTLSLSLQALNQTSSACRRVLRSSPAELQAVAQVPARSLVMQLRSCYCAYLVPCPQAQLPASCPAAQAQPAQAQHEVDALARLHAGLRNGQTTEVRETLLQHLTAGG